MKTKTKPKLHISLSREHKKYQSDVADAFKDFDVSFDGGLMRFSAEEMAMQIMISFGVGLASSAMWDSIKFAIKKLHKKFSTARITLRDSKSIMYTVKSDLSVIVVVIPDRLKEFQHIKTFDDLAAHLKKESASVNSTDWKETKLTDIGEFSKGSGITKDQLTKTGHNAIRYGELYTKFDFQIKKIYSFIPSSIIDTAKKVTYGDIIFAGSGETIDEIGKSAAYLIKEDAYAGGDTIIFRPKNANSLFLCYFLNSGEARKKLRELGQGQSVVHIYKNDIESLKLHLPSHTEQNRIVSVLETWNKSIEKLEQKIEAKKQIKKGLMQDLLTGKKRLTGFKDKWETVTLGDVSEFVNGYTFKSSDYCDDGKYKIITIANVQDGFMFIDEPKTINELPFNISGDQVLKKGDILISMTGNVGRVCIVNNDNCLLNQRVGKIKPININKDLLYLFLYDRKFLSQMIGGAQGGAQANLSTGDIKEYSFDIPKGKEEQDAIAEILTTADKEITELEKKLSILKEQKRYLLNNLITGRIRIPEALSTQLTK